MAKGRIISRTWSTSRKRAALYRQAGKLAEFCLQLFPLLVVHSDDYGGFDGDAETVRLRCDPGSPRSTKDFESALKLLQQVNLIVRYTADGRADGKLWLQIVKFDDHQPGLRSHRTERRSPAPPTHTESAETAGNSLPIEPNRTEPNLTEQKGEVPLRGFGPSDLQNLWNLHAEAAGLRPCLELIGDRLVGARCRLKDRPTEAYWTQVIDRITQSSFCRGQNDRGWIADMDFLVRKTTHVKVLEGKYDDRAKTKADVPVDSSGWDRAREYAEQRVGKL